MAPIPVPRTPTRSTSWSLFSTTTRSDHRADGDLFLSPFSPSLPHSMTVSDLVGTHPRTDAPFQRSRSEDHTSELQSLMRISYAFSCLKKTPPIIKKKTNTISNYTR